VTLTLKRETANWDATRHLVMIHVAMKLRQIIFSGSEVTVRTNDKCDVRTYVRTDVTEPNTIAPPFRAGANNLFFLPLGHMVGVALLLGQNAPMGQSIKVGPVARSGQ
jgi:hypothetical protein